jgi:hypothetical protein
LKWTAEADPGILLHPITHVMAVGGVFIISHIREF